MTDAALPTPASAEAADLLLTPFGDADRVASACALVGLTADVVPVGGERTVVLPRGDVPADRAAQALSRIAAGSEVLQLSYADGQVQAHRWLRGAPDGDLAPGVVLAALPTEVEALLLGRTRAADLPGAAASNGVPDPAVEHAVAHVPWGARLARAEPWSALAVAVAGITLGLVELGSAVRGRGSLLVGGAWFALGAWFAWRGLRTLRTRRSLRR